MALGGLITLGLLAIHDGLPTRYVPHMTEIAVNGSAFLGEQMSWIAAYGVLAAVMAVVVYAASIAIPQKGLAGPDNRLAWSVAAGLFWPVVCIGLVQLAVLGVLGRLGRLAA